MLAPEYNMFAACTFDTINYIADAKVRYKNHYIKLRDKDGKPKIKACMSLLGFDPKYDHSIILRTEEDRRARETNPDMLVRTPKENKQAQWCNIYTGKLKQGYIPPKDAEEWLENVYFGGDIMQVDISVERHNIEDFGECL